MTTDQPPGLDLTPTERRLLHVLSSEPGRVFTRAELMARVMPDSIVLERTIDAHVKALRRKIGAGHIETVRRTGYRFTDCPNLPTTPSAVDA